MSYIDQAIREYDAMMAPLLAGISEIILNGRADAETVQRTVDEHIERCHAKLIFRRVPEPEPRRRWQR